MTPVSPERIIAPSLLAANFAILGREAKRAEESGADWLHLDVMDGNFVPNISFGASVIGAVRNNTTLPFDVQLMVQRPFRFIEAIIKAGATRITVHVESDHLRGDIRRTFQQIRGGGCKVGLAVNPETPLSHAEPFLADIDLLLLMTVHPGFGGQLFLPEVVEKIEAAYVHRTHHAMGFLIEVDGGINEQTAGAVLSAGADTLVAGTALFHAPDMASAIQKLRHLPG